MVTYETYDHAGQICWEDWRRRGIEVPVFDKDGTLTSFHEDEFIEKVIKGLIDNGLTELYDAIALVSNSNRPSNLHQVAGNLSDALNGIGVFGLCQGEVEGKARKPRPIMATMVAQHFKLEPRQLGIVGDRRLVDVSFGRKTGVGAIALCKKVGEGDERGVPALRAIERGIVFVEYRLGIN